ncbi:hypothetical protein [Christiangramia flava]|nr:hypothetical protein [Christiangramia flava]
MTSLSNIIQNFSFHSEARSVHHKSFLNTPSTSSRSSWYGRRRYS